MKMKKYYLMKKMQVQDAVVNAKLVYGLESLQLPKTAHKKMDMFQLTGLRKLLRMETTHVNRANTNEEVYRRTEEALRSDRGEGAKKFIKLTPSEILSLTTSSSAGEMGSLLSFATNVAFPAK